MQQDARTFYQGEAGQAYHELKRAIPPEALPWVAKVRASKIQPYLGSAQSLLEYGTGYGWNLASLQCLEKTGYDVSETLRPAVEALGIRFLTDTKSLPDSSFHAILCHHMLEHAVNPASELAEMHRLLKPTGTLILFVPYEKEKRYRAYDRSEPNHHLFSWNPQTLGNLVELCGFEAQAAKVGRFGYERFAAKKAIQFKLGEMGFKWIHQLAHLLKPANEVVLVARKK